MNSSPATVHNWSHDSIQDSPLSSESNFLTVTGDSHFYLEALMNLNDICTFKAPINVKYDYQMVFERKRIFPGSPAPWENINHYRVSFISSLMENLLKDTLGSAFVFISITVWS